MTTDRLSELIREASIPQAPAARFDAVGQIFIGRLLGVQSRKMENKFRKDEEIEKVIFTYVCETWTRKADGLIIQPTAVWQPNPEATQPEVGTEVCKVGDNYTVWVNAPSAQFRAYVSALKEIGASGFAEGQLHAIIFTGLGVPSEKGRKPPKEWSVMMQAPVTAASMAAGGVSLI